MGDRWTAQKLGRLDQIVVDLRCTHLDFRIAYYIAHRMDRATGEARIRQSDIAEAVQVTRRAVQISAERLRLLGIRVNVATRVAS